MPKSLYYGLPIACGLLLLLLLSEAWAGWLPKRALRENRSPAAWPQWQAANPDAYLLGIERFVEDRFPGRSLWIRANNTLNYEVFGRSPRPDKVLLGDSGWLYKGGIQLDLYRGKFRFSASQLDQLVATLEDRRRRVEAQGGSYYLAIAPLKARIYPAFVPPQQQVLNPQSALEQLTTALELKSQVDYIDLLTPLRTYRQQNPQSDTLLYFKTDHHWSPLGGLVATQALIEYWRHDFPDLPPVDLSNYYFQIEERPGMRLAEMLGLEHQLSEPFSVLHPRTNWPAQAWPRPDYRAPAGFPFPDNFALEYRQLRTDLPSLFVNRESFGDAVLRPLSAQFSRSFFYFDEWEHGLNASVYAKEGGTIYLQLIWEGMLYKLLEEETDDYGW